MSDGETAALVAEVSADPKYVQAKTSVWWDIENCRVPRDCDPYSIAQNISSALSKMNYCGPVSISAYGDTNQIPNHVQQALSSTGVSLNHVPAGVKDASDKKILVDMLFWAVDNPAPATYLLISGDRDFSNALHQLRMRRYDILLAQPVQASAALVSAAKTAWLWTSLVAGGGPIAKSELGVNLEEPAKKCNQQGQIQDNQQLSSGSKRSPPPSISEKKSSRARTETTKSGSTQCSIIYNGPHRCYNCSESGHLSRKCTKKLRKCFLCGVDGHMRLFCNHVRPKPAQSPQESASYNNNTLIGPAFEQSMEQKKQKCFRCREEGHMVASCPQKRRLMPAQSQPASGSSNKLPSNDPIEHASEDFMEPNKRRRYVTNIEGHLLSSCPQGLPIPAESQLESASYNDLPFEQFATHNTGVRSSSQGQQLYEMPKVDEPNVPFTQASNSGPVNVHGISVISDSVVPSRSP